MKSRTQTYLPRDPSGRPHLRRHRQDRRCLVPGSGAIDKGARTDRAQYNVLRILRGAEPEGLLCRGISERMISRDPDITRLLDRMEKHGLITRESQTEDRRVIKTRITTEGLATLKKLDQPVQGIAQKQFRHMKAAQRRLCGSCWKKWNSAK